MPLARLRSLVRNVFRRGRVERELDDELRAYVDQLTEEKIAAGLSPDEARRAARIELGGMEQVKEEVRSVRAGVFLETIGQDLRYGVRTLAKNPGFTAVVVITLALGIGVNTAIFGLVNAFMFKPLPGVKDPDRLVWFRGSWSYPNVRDFRDQNEVFSGITAIGGRDHFSLNAEGRTDLVQGELVTADYLSVLGVDVAVGRGFQPEDELPGARPVLIVSHELWRTRFGGDRGLVGRTVVLNGVAFVVVGIGPPGFIGAEMGLPRDVWVPLALRPQLLGDGGDSAVAERDRLQDPNVHWMNVIARLKPEVSVDQAQAATVTIAARIAAANGDSFVEGRVRAATLLPVVGGLDPRDRLDAVYVAAFLMAIVGLVLLIACANVAGLLLARAAFRTKEMGVRRALGASRARIVRQLLTESLLLALGGGALGLLLAVWTNGLVVRVARSTPFAPPDLSADARVLAFTLAVSVVTALVFGLAPALQASRIDVVSAVKQESGALANRFRRSRLRSGLLVAQLALSALLLVGAGLFTRSLQNARSVAPGFVVDNGMMLAVEPGALRYSEEKGQQLYRRLVDGVGALPGVERASLMRLVPLGLSFAEGMVSAPGTEERSVQAGFNVVGPGYFATMGIHIVRGRELDARDAKGAPSVVVVNETLARQLFPDQDPVGKRLRFGGESAPLSEIVGVAADGKYATLGEKDRPYLYQPLLQEYRSGMTMIVRTARDPESLIGAVRDRIREIDPDVPISDVKTLAEQVSFSLLPARAGATLLGGFGLLALLLAAIGVYGLVAFSVRQRTHEIGVRVALGATRADVLRLVIGKSLMVVGIGLAIGLGMAFVLARVIDSFLYGVTPSDPATFVGVSGLLVAVAALASYLPARRALKVEPMDALRYE